MESKKTNYASVYDAKTRTVHINGMWSDTKFRRLTEDVGIDKIGSIIVHDGGTLHLACIELYDIQIERYGFLSARSSVLHDVTNNGIVRVRNTMVTNCYNDGQFFLSQSSKLRFGDNDRHIEISKSYAAHLQNGDYASIKATSSYLVDCTATNATSLNIGSSRLIGCLDALSAWSDPYFDSPDAKPYIIDYRLLFAAVELLCTVDYIGSTMKLTDRHAKLIKYINSMLDKKHTLPYEIAKDLIATVHPLSVKAQDNLRHTVGHRAVLFASGGVGPRSLLKKKK